MSKLISRLGYDALRLRQHNDVLLFGREATKVISTTSMQVRTKYWSNRHRDPKYRRERGRKMWVPLDLPDFDEMRKEETEKLSPDQVRARMKERGVVPPNPWEEREVFASCTMSLMEPYEPYEADGKSSSLLDKVKAPLATGTEMVKNRRSLGTIRAFEGEDFELEDFAKQSLDIYKRAHELLASPDGGDEIFDYVTEHCYPFMKAGLDRHTIIWKFLDEIEPAKVVHVRATDLVQKGNKFAQLTVRMHNKQIMAAFDRHGRLVMGSPTDVKEVLEYVVFEKYLANEYGLWRIHDRIRPGSTKKPEVPRTQIFIH